MGRKWFKINSVPGFNNNWFTNYLSSKILIYIARHVELNYGVESHLYYNALLLYE